MFKKVFGLILIVAVVILSVGCSSYNDTSSEKYFVSKTGKIKNPYTMSNKELWEYNDIVGAGVFTDDDAYMGQFIKPGTNNFDMKLVKEEMEINPTNGDIKLDLFRLENKKKDPDIENLITQTKNRLPEIQGQIEDYISKYLDKQNTKVHIQIGHVDNVYRLKESASNYGNKDKDYFNPEGQNYITVAFLIPKQGDIPEMYTSATFTLGADNKFELSDYGNSIKHLLKYNIELSWVYKAYEDEVNQYIKGASDILKKHGLKLVTRGNKNFIASLSKVGLESYYVNKGIELNSANDNYDKVLLDHQFEKYIAGEFTPTKEALLDMFNTPERDKYIKRAPYIVLDFTVCPVDESRIVSPKVAKGIHDEINKLDTPQITCVFDVYGGFVISKYGIKKDLYGTKDSYTIIDP